MSKPVSSVPRRCLALGATFWLELTSACWALVWLVWYRSGPDEAEQHQEDDDDQADHGQLVLDEDPDDLPERPTAGRRLAAFGDGDIGRAVAEDYARIGVAHAEAAVLPAPRTRRSSADITVA